MADEGVFFLYSESSLLHSLLGKAEAGVFFFLSYVQNSLEEKLGGACSPP